MDILALDSAEQSEARESVGVETRSYIGVSRSGGYLSIAVVNQGGQLVFAQEVVASRYGSNQDAILAEAIDRYCAPDVRVVLAFAGGRRRGSYRSDTRHYTPQLSSAAAACLTSPYSEAACAVLDAGEGAACSFYLYKAGALFEINPTQRPMRAGSLGRFYRQICAACGPGELWQVMRLAAEGEPDEDVRRTLTSSVTVTDLGVKGVHEGRIAELLALSGHAATLARTGQAVFEESLFVLLRNLQALTPSSNLVFTGWCALNTQANGGIVASTAFKNVYIPCAPWREGNAVGAALLAHREENPGAKRKSGFQSPFVGSAFSAEHLTALTQGASGLDVQVCNADAPRRAASLLARGQIVGWIQGRAELGGRSLGNRSILMDPRRPDAKEMIAALGQHAGARPFGLSVMHEYGAECFDHYQLAPYMDRALRVRPKLALRIAAVVNRNGVAEVQTVKRDWNEMFYDLMFSFYTLTALPVVTNMSYFAPGSIGHSEDDVLTVFRESALDALFVNELLLLRKP